MLIDNLFSGTVLCDLSYHICGEQKNAILAPQFGKETVMNNVLSQEVEAKEYKEKDKDKDKVGCEAVGYQDVNVCIPVTIKTFGEAGNAKTQCLGKAVIASGCDKCPGKPGGVCKFTISQKLRVEVPVVFGARAEVGEASVDCDCDKVDYDCDTFSE